MAAPAIEPTIEPVDDPDDPRVVDYRRLNDTSYRRAVESTGPFHRGLFVAEGWTVLDRLLRSRYEARSILVVDAKVDRLRDLLASHPRHRGIGVFAAPQEVVDAVVGFPLHRGVVAAADRGLASFADQVIARARRLVVLEGLNDAENLGAVLRSAHVLGADGVLLDPTCADPLGRRAVRVSMGHALLVPLARFTWAEHAATLRDAGFRLHALTPRADAVDITTIRPDADARVALAFGAEGPGLTETALAAADVAVRIPIVAAADSLNVAAAAAIACQRLFVVPDQPG